MAAKKQKAKQTNIPGTEKPVHKDVAKAAGELYDVRQERMALSEQEGKAAAKLLELMKKHGLTSYTEEDMTVEVVAVEERVKVKKKKDRDEE